MAVEVISTIKPKNNRTFPVVEACDVKIDETTRLDAKLSKYDERVGFIEQYLLGLEPDTPDSPDNPDTPDTPTMTPLPAPHIVLYEDEDVVVTLTPLGKPSFEIYNDTIVEPDEPVEPTILALAKPEFEIYEDVIGEPDDPEEPDAPEEPEKPTVEQLAKPVIEIYKDSVVEPEEPDQPTITTLAQPNILIISGNTYAINVNKSYALPAENDGKTTRTFALWVKVQVTDTDGGVNYYEEIFSGATTNVRNQDYTLMISDMATDGEGDCFFTYTIDGLTVRQVYPSLPKHSICQIVEAEVIGVGDCYEVAPDAPVEPTIEQLAQPVIEIYEDIAVEPDDPEEPDEPTIPKLDKPEFEIYEDSIVEPTTTPLAAPEFEIYEDVA